MCGISGIYRRDGSTPDRGVLRRMAESLRHRGPDDSGIYANGSIGFGHTRLSIIDLSAQGHQPMHSDDGRFVIAYNGEIYNFREMRKRLEDMGHRLRGRSDTEVALHAFMEWGTAAFAGFEGMFAISVWDNRERRLHLARDRFGIKPLYYHLAPSGDLVFGSEIKAILASDEAAPQIGWQGLHEFLYFGTALGANTMFDGIRKLMPGHLLSIDSDGVKSGPYASILDVDAVEDDLPTATRTVRSLLEDAVKSHLVSDVPVGVFLSGGIDSSAITAFASKHYGGGLKTFSAGFDLGSAFNELPEARLVAEHFSTEHHELQIGVENVSEIIERLVSCHDEPLGDPAHIPLLLLCEQVSGGGGKVILKGDGGDEMFGGYPRYIRLKRRFWWRLVSRPSVWLHPLAPRISGRDGAELAFGAFAQSDPAMLMAYLSASEPPKRPPSRVFTAESLSFLESTDPFLRHKELHQRLEHLDIIQRMMYIDTSIILADLFLEKQDKTTMSCSMEVRVPMLDTHLAAYAMGLPSNYKVRGGEKKYILRQALRGIVPDSILDRPKTGFSVPFVHWFRTSLADYVKSVLFDPSTQRAGLFDDAAVARCVQEHMDGRRNNAWLIYKLLTLALWSQEHRLSV